MQADTVDEEIEAEDCVDETELYEGEVEVPPVEETYPLWKFWGKQIAAMALVGVNGIAPLFLSDMFFIILLKPPLGETLWWLTLYALMAVLLVNVYLIAVRYFDGATLLCIIGGVLTFPVGILGIAAGATTRDLSRLKRLGIKLGVKTRIPQQFEL